MPLTKPQTLVVNALRKGATKSLRNWDEEQRGPKIIAVKAVDLLTLCEAGRVVDGIRETVDEALQDLPPQVRSLKLIEISAPDLLALCDIAEGKSPAEE